MKINKIKIIAFFSVIILSVPWLLNSYPKSAYYIDTAFNYLDSNFAALFLRDSITIAQLQNKYKTIGNGQPKIRVLVMPGHEPNYGGAEYGSLKERDMTVDLAKYLQGFLESDKHYEVIVPRDKNEWNPIFKKYFEEQWDNILLFLSENKNEMIRLVNNGVVSKTFDGIVHNTVPKNVAVRLYGINKWVNDNDIDIAVHIHFNDYPRKNNYLPGKYSGFAIYIPERQYSNSTTTKAIADLVFKRLAKYNAISNLPKEMSGIIEEQELIAIGSHNTLDAPSMLIEYGYIYEPQFTEPSLRDEILRDMAFQTYLGIQDFFGDNSLSLKYDTQILPYIWKNNIDQEKFSKVDVFALQTALSMEGLYPGIGKNKNDCPRSGIFGPCTSEALSKLQKMYNIINENNSVGPLTKSVLNSRYSSR